MGIALLIAIFILLLIGVVAIALIVSSGTETALAGNYRSSTGVYYAAVAGLEEARARLRSNNPNSFNNTAPGFLPPSGTPLAACAPVYVINPVGGEVIAPWDPASTYPDNEFNQEFGAVCGAPPNPSPSTASIWNRSPLNGLPFPGPFYKWVRVNGITEQSANLDTSPYDGIDAKLIYYDGTNLNDTNGGNQVLEITALAVLPNGSQKLLQYLVAPSPLALPPFLSALTLSGSPNNSPVFQAPANNAVYAAKGDDQDCSGNLTGSKFAAIGLFGDYSGSSYGSDRNGIVGGIPTNVNGANPQMSYTGVNSAPDVEYLNTYPTNMQSPGQLDAIAQAIIQNADVTIPSGPTTYPLPTVYGSSLTSLGMSSTNPLTVVVNGNLDVTNWTGTGYGLLLVTGTFTYDPATTWNGIVLVIGQGAINNKDHGQYQQMNGAVFVAKTRDTNGILLTGRIGGASVSFDAAMQGNGVRYSSCWIQKSQPTSGYKILSFHEIAQ
jgi:hypothetical protein